MDKTLKKLVIIILGIVLTACSSLSQKPTITAMQTSGISPNAAGTTVLNNSGQAVAVDTAAPNGKPIAANLQRSMDGNDRQKLSRSLDAGLGKTTHWTNTMTGTTYTVTPVKKLTINGNPFCREYSVVMTRSGKEEQSGGTACVASDGNWQAAGN